MIIKVFLIALLFVVEIPSNTLLGKASLVMRSFLGAGYIQWKPLSTFIERKILKEELPNFKQVSPCLYRGGQPLGDGYKYLKSKGIRTIINLRGVDRGEPYDPAFTYVHIPIQAYLPREEDVVAFLKVMQDEESGPVFLHCFHGSDRTGLFVAIYRMVCEGWTKEAAMEEMLHGGHGFHEHLQQNLIYFFQHLDLNQFV